MLDGVLIILGGAFLLTPGFITDIVGAAAADPADARGVPPPAHPHDAAPRTARVGARGGRGAARAAATAATAPRTRRPRRRRRSCPRAPDPPPAMTVPGDEQAQTGSGEFRDVVDVQSAGRVAAGRGADCSSSLGRLGERDGAGDRRRRARGRGRGGRSRPRVDSWERAVAGPLELDDRAAAGALEAAARRAGRPDRAGAARADRARRARGARHVRGRPCRRAAPLRAAVRRARDRRGRRAAPRDRGTGVRTHRWGPVGRGEPGTAS